MGCSFFSSSFSLVLLLVLVVLVVVPLLSYRAPGEYNGIDAEFAQLRLWTEARSASEINTGRSTCLALPLPPTLRVYLPFAGVRAFTEYPDVTSNQFVLG